MRSNAATTSLAALLTWLSVPIQAIASVNDILGGMFGVIAILAALKDRELSGKGGVVQVACSKPTWSLWRRIWPRRHHRTRPALLHRPAHGQAVGRLRRVRHRRRRGAQVFVGVVTETQWRGFCGAFLPISFADGRTVLRRQPPHTGEHSLEIAREAGLSEAKIANLVSAGILTASAMPAFE